MSTDIFAWLDEIPTDFTDPISERAHPLGKRRRLNFTQLESANDADKDLIMSHEGGESPSTRPKAIDDETSQVPYTRITQGSEAGYSPSGQSRQSERSGRLSTQKHLQLLRLGPHGIKFRDLTHFEDKPHSLEVLLEVVDIVMEGRGILSSSARKELELAAQSHTDFKWVLRSSGYFSDARDNVGHTPSFEDVLTVVAAAAECSTYGHPKANWNLEVHQPVLKLAFRPPSQAPFNHLVNFMGR